MTPENNARDAGDIVLQELPKAEFPVPVEWERLRVWIDPKVHAAIVSHACENKSIELCGVLLGDLVHDEQGAFLRVTASIRGEHASNKTAQVTFTQETWAHIHKEMDTNYAGMHMVGWYHTHPGFGVFLSIMDMFIHENFFNNPGDVAFVIDPKSGDEGFFCWKKGKVERMSRHWVGNKEKRASRPGTAAGLGDVEKIVAAMQYQVDMLAAMQKRLRRQIRFFGLVLAVLLVVGVVGTVGVVPHIRAWAENKNDADGSDKDENAETPTPTMVASSPLSNESTGEGYPPISTPTPSSNPAQPTVQPPQTPSRRTTPK